MLPEIIQIKQLVTLVGNAFDELLTKAEQVRNENIELKKRITELESKKDGADN